MSCRSMAACCVLGGFSVLLCSCALVRKPAAVYGGPLFRSLPDDSADNDHPVPLTIIDDRPDWEKLYYPGSNVVERYDWAITFVPAENFRPRPFDSLRHQMASAAAKLPIRPARISIRLTSFQITFDERDKQRQRHLIAEAAKAKILEQERKEREEEERNEALHGKSDDDEDDNHESNFAKQLVGEFSARLCRPRWMPRSKELRRTSRTRATRFAGRNAVYRPLPRNFKNAAMSPV